MESPESPTVDLQLRIWDLWSRAPGGDKHLRTVTSLDTSAPVVSQGQRPRACVNCFPIPKKESPTGIHDQERSEQATSVS